MESALTTSDSPPCEGSRGLRAAGQRRIQSDIDPSILSAAQSGDSVAIERFVRHYERAVFAFLSRSMGRGPQVEDLAQEVFLRVLRALPQFELRQAKVSTWIFQIAVRLIQDQRKRPQRALVAVTDDLRDARQSPEESCARRRVLNRIEVLVEELPREQRMALVLIEFHGLTQAEAAQALGCEVGTVKTRVYRARKFLRDALDAEQGEIS